MSERKHLAINPLPDNQPGFGAWFDGVIRIIDPGYLDPRAGIGEEMIEKLSVSFQEPGLWEITTTNAGTPEAPRTGSLEMRRVATNPLADNTETVLLGTILVDSGSISIVSDLYERIRNFDEYISQMPAEGLAGGEIVHVAGTLTVSTGGDGEFPVYGTRMKGTDELTAVGIEIGRSSE